MRDIIGKNIGLNQGRWAYNTYACDDAYDASSKTEGLIVDAHGWERDSRWVMELNEGIVDVQNYVLSSTESLIFLNVCNPTSIKINARQGQTIIYALTVVRGSGSNARWIRAEEEEK